MMQLHNKKVAYLGILTALALIFSYVESLIPIHFAVPGMKLGLANVVVVVVLYKIGAREAFLVSCIRVIIGGFLFANLMSILFSLVGCTMSLVVMAVARARNRLSIMGVSVLGATFHNLGQVLVAMIVVESFQVLYYFSMLLVAAIVTGIMIGIIANEMIKRLKLLGEMI